MNVTKLIEFAEVAVAYKMGFSLSHLQKVILQECCQNPTKTYEQIASELNYSPNYLKKKVIPLLWRILSETFGEKVTKANCYSVLEKNALVWESSPPTEMKLERADGPVPLGSPFYVRRPHLEQLGYEELLESGALLCLQGMSKVGKTSLLVRLLNDVEKESYRTIRLSLNVASTQILSSVEKFVRWFCANITQQFENEIYLQEFWRDDVGALTNCSLYLKQYLLSRSPVPIVLALDEFDRLFAHPTIANDFLRLLRSWYEEGKDNPLWQKLRIVLVYSTEVHLLLKTSKTPIDIGSSLVVPPFNALQVRQLAGYHRLYLTSSEVDRLQSQLGGFPDLVRKVFYHAVRDDLDWSDLISNLASDRSIVSDRLHEKLHWLRTHPDLLAAYRQVLNSDRPLVLESQIAFQLQSLGLVNQQEDGIITSCELYRQYFRERL
ncbi:MAG: AAA-like domain-containing protein [Cyanobacteria bacterium SBLK]|nr:AAA-like domain-containing protein [Cyanobacteria bacterium SBLK]